MIRRQAYKLINKKLIELKIKASRTDRGALKLQLRLDKKVQKIFKSQSKYYIKEISKLSIFKKGFVSYDTKTLEGDIKKIGDTDPHKALLTTAIVNDMADSIDFGAIATVETVSGNVGVNLPLMFSHAEKEAVKILNAKKKLELSNFRGNINGTTNKRITDIVQSGMENGLDEVQIAKLINAQTDAGVFGPARSEMIARYETRSAMAQGELGQWKAYAKDSGNPVNKLWVTEGDGKVRDSHLENEAVGPIPYDAVWGSTGDDAAPSSADFGCRCTMDWDVVI